MYKYILVITFVVFVVFIDNVVDGECVSKGELSFQCKADFLKGPIELHAVVECKNPVKIDMRIIVDLFNIDWKFYVFGDADLEVPGLHGAKIVTSLSQLDGNYVRLKIILKVKLFIFGFPDAVLLNEKIKNVNCSNVFPYSNGGGSTTGPSFFYVIILSLIMVTLIVKLFVE